jgi:hypothetical protein
MPGDHCLLKLLYGAAYAATVMAILKNAATQYAAPKHGLM